MPLSFTRAPTVASGDPITNTQMATLGAAFNDRFRSGIGDGTYRLRFLWESIFRQMRNSDGGSAFPSQSEFLEYYATLDPLDATWPLTGAGFPEGANLANPLNVWVFGSDASTLDPEGSRINLVTTGTVDMSAVNAWEIAKTQRGGYDPNTFAVSSELLAAAEAHLLNWGVIYERSYGSWFRMDVATSQLYKPPAGMLARMLNTFVREFRGSTTQRSAATYHLQSAFDFDWFFTHQYHLAPALGVDDGLGNVSVTYPSFSTVSNILAGGFLGSRSWAPGFSLTGWRILVTGLQSEVQLTVMAGVEELGSLVLSPDGGGNASAVYYLETAKIEPSGVTVRFDTDLELLGTFDIEFTELVTSIPSIGDAYAFLRCAARDSGNIPDGTGEQFDYAKTISDAYKTLGCIVSPGASDAGVNEVDVNTNAVFDAVRRLSQCIRQSRRQQFTGYAVEGGKSVLWFSKTFSVSGVTIEPLAPLMNIAHTAPANGVTNEWVLDVELRPYDESETSLFKPSAYTDYYSFINRCHFYSNRIPTDPALLWHLSYNASPVLSPEAPSGWNYATTAGGNLNAIDCGGDPGCEEFRGNFYKSCRIYEPPVEVESVEEIDGELKITLTGRLHHCEDAPASIDRNTATWDMTALRAEPFRSVENGLREYLVKAGGGLDCVRPAGSFQPPAGNSAIDAPVWSNPDPPYGACYPSFRWTKLIPVPYADANDVQNAADTHFVHDAFTTMELYLRAMCEGYVDGELSAEDACLYDVAVLYDYTFERMCYVAFGSTRMDLLPAIGVGHGPLPNTRALAATFNQFSSAVNLLTRVRVMLPTILECNTASVLLTENIVAYAGDGSPAECGETNAYATVSATAPSELEFLSDGWTECSGEIQGYVSVRLTGNCSGTLWELERRTTGAKFRYSFTDTEYRNAIPESWRDQFEETPGVLIRETICSLYLEAGTTSDPLEAELCYQVPSDPTPAFPDGAGNYVRFERFEGDAEVCSPGTCRFLTDEAAALPSGVPSTAVAIGYNGLGDLCLQTADPHHTVTLTAFSNQVPTFSVPFTA